jgi:Flp pilus assembly protein CpaB
MRFTLSRYRLRNTLLAGALAVAGAILVFLYVASYRNDVESGAGLVEVFVAAKDIPEGTDGSTVAGNGYLKKESVLRRNRIEGAIPGPDRLANLAASQKILAGEQVTLRQFHPATEEGVLASICCNQRAMTIAGEPDALLAGTVQTGDRVDVVANVAYTIKTSGSSGSELRRVATRIILHDIGVLEAPKDDSGGGGGLGGQDSSTITLAVTDSQAQKLMFAEKNGTWWLILRPVARPADSLETVQTIESILGDGLGPKGIDQITSGHGPESINSGS